MSTVVQTVAVTTSPTAVKVSAATNVPTHSLSLLNTGAEVVRLSFDPGSAEYIELAATGSDGSYYEGPDVVDTIYLVTAANTSTVKVVSRTK